MRFIYSKSFRVFFVCLILLAGLVFLQTKNYLAPIKNIFLQAPRPFIKSFRYVFLTGKNFFYTIYSLKKVVSENIQLKEKVFLLEQNLVLFEQEKNENIVLRSELGFTKTAKNQLIPCNVMSYNSLQISDSIEISCGLSHGSEVGNAVISQGYLIGKVNFVSQNSSTVLLSVSSRFSADAKILASGLVTLAQGSFGSGIILDQLPQNEDFEKKSYIVTAGINTKIPKNILIGQIGETISKPGDLFKKVTVISPVDFRNLDFVFLVK